MVRCRYPQRVRRTAAWFDWASTFTACAGITLRVQRENWALSSGSHSMRDIWPLCASLRATAFCLNYLAGEGKDSGPCLSSVDGFYAKPEGWQAGQAWFSYGRLWALVGRSPRLLAMHLNHQAVKKSGLLDRSTAKLLPSGIGAIIFCDIFSVDRICVLNQPSPIAVGYVPYRGGNRFSLKRKYPELL